MTTGKTRIAPIPSSEYTDEQATIAGGRGGARGELNFVRTLVQHPKLYGSWYTTPQLMEVVFTVANYSLMAMVTNSFGIQPEADVEKAWKPF